MTVERDPNGQCAGKLDYGTKHDAKVAAKRLRRRGRMTAYRCPHCAGYHIGHTPPKGKRT